MTNELFKYLDIEKNFYKDLCHQLGNDVLFYCLVGSLGRGDIIPGWSDIDILLVIKEYNKSILKKINKVLKKNSKEVKIGVTIYTPEEFKNNKDPKTLHYIKSIINKTYKPRIIAKKIKIKLPDRRLVGLFDRVDFTKSLHALKRELLLGRDYDEKKTYKTIITLLKILLRKKHVAFVNYKDVLEKANKYLGVFNFSSPEEIIANTKLTHERYDEYVKFLSWLKIEQKFIINRRN